MEEMNGRMPDEAESRRMPQVGEPYLGLAREVLQLGGVFAPFRKRHEAASTTRGLPAVMRELMTAEGTMTPGEIAARLGVTDARVANVLRVMEERGWITRRRDQADRRRVEVELTDAGKVECRFRMEQGMRFCAAFLQELGEDDARDFVRIMRRTCEVMERMGSEGFPPGPPSVAMAAAGRAASARMDEEGR